MTHQTIFHIRPYSHLKSAWRTAHWAWKHRGGDTPRSAIELDLLRRRCADQRAHLEFLTDELNATRRHAEAEYWRLTDRVHTATDLADERLAALRAANAENRQLRRLLQRMGVFVTGLGESLTVEATERPRLHETDVRGGNIPEGAESCEIAGLVAAG